MAKDFFECMDEATNEAVEVKKAKEAKAKANFKKVSPNAAQLEAIEAPADSAVRVLAPPGSGKTFVIEHRYTFLLNSFIPPRNIVAVTFTKKMSQELMHRIINQNPTIIGTAAEKQITTIHALCYRMLAAEGYKMKVPPNWELKKLINEIAEKIYPKGKVPGWKEIFHWINAPKIQNLSPSQDAEFYLSFIPEHAQELDEIRHQFDELMALNGWVTFGDMLYKVEQMFQKQPEILAKYQQMYTHLIVDEGQDTGKQSMRILSALAEPQNNFFIVGDADQCVLEGQKILTPTGYKKIENIKKYDSIVAATGQGRAENRQVVETSLLLKSLQLKILR